VNEEVAYEEASGRHAPLPKLRGSMPALKEKVQSGLRRAGVYQRVKTSFAYDLYCGLANNGIIEDRQKEVDFYRTLLRGLRRSDLFFDIGANAGDKTNVFLRLGARVVAVEPDEFNQQVLRERFLCYRLVPKPVVIVGKAVGDSVGVETMWIDAPGSALNTLSRKWADTLHEDKTRIENTTDVGEFRQEKSVEMTTLQQLIDLHGRPFFVKIDVEGYEQLVLKGLHCPVPYLSFEVNLPEFRQEGLQCIEMLRDLAADGQFNYAFDCKCGLALSPWQGAEEFSKAFRSCSDKCIEVFWRTARTD
jgi:FkbM family methyltransferase